MVFTWVLTIIETVAHILYNSTDCRTTVARQAIKCRTHLNIARRGIATSIKINKGIEDFVVSSKNIMHHRWEKHDTNANF